MKKAIGKRVFLLICLILAVVTLLAYAQVTGFDFVNLDDDEYVTKNAQVQSGLNSESISWAFTATHASNWHPLTWLSHMLDCQIWGLNPKGHHLTNLIFHILNSLLLFLLLTWMTGSMWRSGFVAALFAVHPTHVESVAWVSERKDVLSTFFLMLILLAYVGYVRGGRKWMYPVVLLLFALGLMAKPMLVTLPLLLLMLDYWPLKRMHQEGKRQSGMQAWARLIVEKIPFFALSAGSSIATVMAQGRGGAVSSLEVYPLGIRAANSLVNFINYIIKMVLPTKLAAFYPHPYDTIPVWQVAGSALLLVGIFALVIRLRGKYPYLAVGWLWYFVTLIPVIGLVQVGLQAMADRYTYVPYIGLLIAIAWLVPDLLIKQQEPRKPPQGRGKARTRTEPISSVASGLGALAVLWIAVLTGLTYSQASHWENSVLLFQNAIENTRSNYIAHNNLGTALKDLGREDEALENFRQAVRFKPDHALANFNLGFSLAQTGETEQALKHFHAGLKTSPEDAKAHFCLGMLYANNGETEKAVAHYNKSLQLDPNVAEAHNNLGVIRTNENKLDEAAKHFREAIKLKLDYVQAHNNLGTVLVRQKKYDKAIKRYQQAIQLDPENGQTRSNYATALYSKGDYAAAWREVQLARKYGYEPSPELVNALSQMMPEPRE